MHVREREGGEEPELLGMSPHQVDCVLVDVARQAHGFVARSTFGEQERQAGRHLLHGRERTWVRAGERVENGVVLMGLTHGGRSG